MSEWIDCIVGDIAAPIRNALVGGPFGSNLVSNDYVDNGIPVIRGQNMGLDRWVSGDFAFVSPAKAQSLSANIARPGDIVFTQRGTLGQVAIVPKNAYDRYVVSQSQMKLTVDPEKAHTLFLYYYFSSPEQLEYIRQNSIQTGVPHTNLTVLRNTPLCLPSVAEQRAIAQILGSLDDKIELNRRMNETLEEIARTIFKSWFVDFDPVFAKSRGEQPPGMDAATAALFPDHFEDSELGPIPAGWHIKLFPEIIDFLEGPGIRNWQYTNTDEGTRFINIRCIQDHDLILNTSNRIRTEEAFGKYEHFLLKEDDIVVSTSGTLGRFAIVREEHLPLVLNTSVIRMRPISSVTTKEFVWEYVESDKFQFELETRASGSVQRNFGPMHLKQIKVLLPPYELLNAYSQITGAIFSRLIMNRSENTKLAHTRDILLPILISGEVRVAEVEHYVEEIA